MSYEVWIWVLVIAFGLVVVLDIVGYRRDSLVDVKNYLAAVADSASPTPPPLQKGDVVHIPFAGGWRIATYTGTVGRRKRVCLRQPSGRIVWRKLRELVRGSAPAA